MGYRTHFEVSGRQERSLLGLVSMGGTNGAASAGGTPVGGVVIGQVTNVKDPDGLGRVKLRFPWLAEGYESDWARMTQFGAGKGNGSLFLPEVNDEVLVAFEFGEFRRPYVVGCLYNGVDKPSGVARAVDAGSGAVQRHYFRSRKNHELVFSDADGDDGVELRTADGKTSVRLSHGDGKVTVTAQGDVEVSATGSVRVESRASVEIKAGAGVTIDGGGGVVQLKGSLIKLN
jgi:uncharacterized protein involved in type VI secretion and phage assembly